jgi:hypothetical protein
VSQANATHLLDADVCFTTQFPRYQALSLVVTGMLIDINSQQGIAQGILVRDSVHVSNHVNRYVSVHQSFRGMKLKDPSTAKVIVLSEEPIFPFHFELPFNFTELPTCTCASRFLPLLFNHKNIVYLTHEKHQK